MYRTHPSPSSELPKPTGVALWVRLSACALLASASWGCVSDGSEDRAASRCVDFEELRVGSSYLVSSDAFRDNGTKMVVDEFQWSNGLWFNGGEATVTGSQESTGSGNDLRLNNANVEVLFGPISGLTLRFADYGGNENLIVNGDLANVDNIAELHGRTLGGVKVSVDRLGSTAIATYGDLTLLGPISTFQIGGQELWIDALCPR